jgi:predicted metalloendopeptidase
LYRHVNGTWIDGAEIPADRSSDGAFYELYQNAEQHVREIIEELGASGGAKGSVAQKIGDLYGSFMDEEKANAAKQLAEEALRNAKSEIDLAVAQSELAVLAAQLSALRKYRKK